MSGLDEILNIIKSQQKENEDRIIKSAENKANEIKSEADQKAEKAYSDYMIKAKADQEREYENSCSSIDASMKRKILKCKVEMIDSVIENTVNKLKNLPANEYFKILEKLIIKHLRSGEGVLYLCKNDLNRIPDDFVKKISIIAEKNGSSIKLSDVPADISDGFVLQYGLVSENCSFRAIIESEKDSVRDTAAKILFG